MDVLTSLYPIITVQSRYGGVYEGGAWHAIPNADAAWSWSDAYAEYMFGEDADAVAFWGSDEAEVVGRGGTPNAAVLDLVERHTGVRQWEYDDDTGTTEREAGEESRTQNGEAGPETARGLLP